MDIACPTCRADYEIDDASVGENGRKVRCSSCGTVWRVFRGGLSSDALDITPLPPPAEQRETAFQEESAFADGPPVPGMARDLSTDELPAGDPPTPGPRRVKWAKEPKAPKPPSALRRAMFSAPAGLALLTLGIIGGAVHQRTKVVDALPQAAPLFAAIGLPVNLRGVAIQNVASRLVEDNGASILVVDGDLKNITANIIDVPRLRFAIRDPKGQEIYIWSAQPDRTKLQPGETLNFRRRLASPPAEARDVSVRFITRADITSGIK
jgi:predicted Zn finger-like uncharacterized protein